MVSCGLVGLLSSSVEFNIVFEQIAFLLIAQLATNGYRRPSSFWLYRLISASEIHTYIWRAKWTLCSNFKVKWFDMIWCWTFMFSVVLTAAHRAVWNYLFNGSFCCTYQWYFSLPHPHQTRMAVSLLSLSDTLSVICAFIPNHQLHSHPVKPISGTAAHPFHFMVHSAGCVYYSYL